MAAIGTEVRLADISKYFGRKQVLRDVDLTIGSGQLVAVLGPSGCGKTTCLRVVAGFEHPEQGRVFLGPDDVTEVPARRRGTGIVFQAYSLFPHLTAIQNVEYGLRVRRIGKASRLKRCRELLELVGIGEQANHYARQLSGGQQQRVALARALAIEPKVLLLDEPLSALDAKVRLRLRDQIRAIQQETGTTTLLVTHDQEEALTMADRVAVMFDGRIQQFGSPDEIYNHPRSPFVAQFVGVVNRVRAHRQGGEVRVLDKTVAVANPDIDAVGDVMALVRPEDIEIEPDPAGPARVVNSILRGSVVSLQVRIDDAPDLVRVDLPWHAAGKLSLNGTARLTIRRTSVVVDHLTAVPQEPDDEAPAGRDDLAATQQ